MMMMGGLVKLSQFLLNSKSVRHSVETVDSQVSFLNQALRSPARLPNQKFTWYEWL